MTDHAKPHANVAGFVLGALTAQEEASFRRHLERCATCRREVDELSSLPDLLDMAAPAVDPPGSLKGRTLAAVESEAAAPARPARERAISPLRRRVLAWTAVAALVVVAAGFLASRTTQSFDREITLVAAETGPASAVARIDDTDLGVEIEMEVEGLPPAPPGFYYECWFVGEGDTLESPNRISAGTFDAKDEGTTVVRMTSAADASRYPNMGVTLEPDDGNPARTGNKVLVSK